MFDSLSVWGDDSRVLLYSKEGERALRRGKWKQGNAARQATKIFYRYRKTSGETGILIRFTEPGDIRGTGLLTLDRADGESSQWIYLPALQRVQRIDAGRKGGRFVNSDYYYEDLRDRKFSRDSHRILGRETLEGASCMLLESVPVEAGDSVYAKRLIWVESDTLLPLRIDFFEKRQDQPAKRWLATRRERIQGYWTVMDSTLTDLENGHQTRLSVDKIAYDRRLPAHLFSSRTLEDEHAEAAFRP